MTGPDVRVDRLRLHVAGVEPAAAAEVARAVAQRLAPGLAELAGGGGAGAARGPAAVVSVQVVGPAAGQTTPAALARSVTDAVLAALGAGAPAPSPGAAP